MMTPETWAEIRRLYHVEKLSQREIARSLKINRRTIRRALRHDHAPPSPARKRASILDPFEKDVKELLAQTPRITAVRMLEELERRGFKGKISIVKDRLVEIRAKRESEAYVRRLFHPGEAAEVDWASCGTIEVGGRKRRVSAFVMVLAFSRMVYLEFTLSEGMEEFLRCHQNAFTFFGGCPRKCLYDNLRCAVLAHHGPDVRWNPRFMDFAGHFLYKPVACNRAAGWEKTWVSSYTSSCTFALRSLWTRSLYAWRSFFDSSSRTLRPTTALRGFSRPSSIMLRTRETGIARNSAA